MILSLFAAALLSRFQQNPAGTSVFPTQAAFYSATGGTATVEIRNSSGQVVPLVDTNNVQWPSVTITLPAATAVGLGWELTQTAPDGIHPLEAVSSQYSAIVLMNCAATYSPVGTYDSSVGAGNGIATGYPAPTASTPTLFAGGNSYSIGYGAIVSVLSSASTAYQVASFSGGALTENVDNSGGSTANLPLYLGWALPGSSPSATVWKIQKITYDSNNNVTSIGWAGGSATFVNAWASRATYTYN